MAYKMMLVIGVLVVAAVALAGMLLTVGCTKKPVPVPVPVPSVVEDAHPKIRIGMTQSDVLRILGPPIRKRDSTKRHSDIRGFGFPSWWRSELALGDKVEMWDYYNAGKGTDTIFFLKGSDKVGHTRFVREGVVF